MPSVERSRSVSRVRLSSWSNTWIMPLPLFGPPYTDTDVYISPFQKQMSPVWLMTDCFLSSLPDQSNL